MTRILASIIVIISLVAGVLYLGNKRLKTELSAAKGEISDYKQQVSELQTAVAGDETAFDDMLSGDENVTVHFPSNLQSVIGGWQSVIDGFGGTNTTILYDLPATS